MDESIESIFCFEFLIDFSRINSQTLRHLLSLKFTSKFIHHFFSQNEFVQSSIESLSNLNGFHFEAFRKNLTSEGTTSFFQVKVSKERSSSLAGEKIEVDLLRLLFKNPDYGEYLDLGAIRRSNPQVKFNSGSFLFIGNITQFIVFRQLFKDLQKSEIEFEGLKTTIRHKFHFTPLPPVNQDLSQIFSELEVSSTRFSSFESMFNVKIDKILLKISDETLIVITENQTKNSISQSSSYREPILIQIKDILEEDFQPFNSIILALKYLLNLNLPDSPQIIESLKFIQNILKNQNLTTNLHLFLTHEEFSKVI